MTHQPNTRRHRRGQTFVEYLGVIVFFLMIFFFLYQSLLILQVRNMLNMAAYAAARQYSVGPSSYRNAISGNFSSIPKINSALDVKIPDLGAAISSKGLALNRAGYHMRPFLKRKIVSELSIAFDPDTEPGFGGSQKITLTAKVQLLQLPFMRQFFTTDSEGNLIMTSSCLVIME